MTDSSAQGGGDVIVAGIPDPPPAAAINLDYLVTGTARSGTVFMARLLSSLGIACGHESLFGQWGLNFAAYLMSLGETDTSPISKTDMLHCIPQPDWFDKQRQRAESSWMAAPFIDSPLLENAAIIHVVRNPMSVLSSLVSDMHMFADGVGEFDSFRELALANMPEVMSLPTEIERACMYWVHWNEMIVQKSQRRRYMVFQAEQLLSGELVEFLNLGPDQGRNAFIHRSINSWNRRERNLSVADLPRGEARDRLIDLAAYFGYDCGSRRPVR